MTEFAYIIEGANAQTDRPSFLLELDRRLYLVGVSAAGYEITPVRWHPLRGYTTSEDAVPEDARHISEILLSLGKEDESRYPLRGESYRAELYEAEGRMRLRIRRFPSPTRFGWRRGLPVLMRLLLSVAAACALTAFAEDLMLTWLEVLLPTLGRGALRGIAWLAELLGAGVLSLTSRRCGLEDLIVRAAEPAGAILLAATVRCRPWMMLVLLPAAGLFYLFAMLMVDRPSRAEGRLPRYRLDRIRLTVTCLLSFSLFMGYLVGPGFYADRADPSGLTEAERTDLDAQLCAVAAFLAEDHWECLSEHEKLNVLRAICDYECRVTLGCRSVEVRTGLLGEGTGGEYTHHTGGFVVDREHLRSADARAVLTTALHETRHAYQNQLADAYDSIRHLLTDEQKELAPLAVAQDIRENRMDYHRPEEGFAAYYDQYMETDARAWADERVEALYVYFLYPDR